MSTWVSRNGKRLSLFAEAISLAKPYALAVNQASALA
jgi:hypothetical protein